MSCDEAEWDICVHIHNVYSRSLDLDLHHVKKIHKGEKRSTFSSSVIQTGSVSGAV